MKKKILSESGNAPHNESGIDEIKCFYWSDGTWIRPGVHVEGETYI